MATEYGNRLRAARKHAGLTQEQLRDLTGVAQSTISSAEREGNGSSDTPVYAKACGVSALWLATGEGEMVESADEAPSFARSRPEPEPEIRYSRREPSFSYTREELADSSAAPAGRAKTSRDYRVLFDARPPKYAALHWSRLPVAHHYHPARPDTPYTTPLATAVRDILASRPRTRHLAENFGTEFLLGGARVPIDFIGETVVSFGYVNRGIPGLSAHRALVRMAALMKHSTGGASGVGYAVILVDQEADVRREAVERPGMIHRVKPVPVQFALEAGLLGITVTRVRTPAEAADILEDWELGPDDYGVPADDEID